MPVIPDALPSASPFKCTVCGIGFRCKKGLASHNRTDQLHQWKLANVELTEGRVPSHDPAGSPSTPSRAMASEGSVKSPPKLRRPRRLKLKKLEKMTKGACSRQRRLCKEMVNALDQAHENGVRSAASELGIAPSLISKWKKQESKLREQVLKEKAAALTGAKLKKGNNS